MAKRKVRRGKGRKARGEGVVFPDTLYVTRQGEGDDAYLSADKAFGEADDGDVVAIYQFVGTRVKRVTHALED